jgi:hypothetical protein
MPRARRSTGRKSVRKSRSPKRVRRVRKSSTKRSPKKVRRVGSKKVNKWVQVVKMQSKKLGLTYKQALSDPRVKAAYKKM